MKKTPGQEALTYKQSSGVSLFDINGLSHLQRLIECGPLEAETWHFIASIFEFM